MICDKPGLCLETSTKTDPGSALQWSLPPPPADPLECSSKLNLEHEGQHSEKTEVEMSRAEQHQAEPGQTCREGDSQACRESCYGQNIIKTPSSHQQSGDSLNTSNHNMVKHSEDNEELKEPWRDSFLFLKETHDSGGLEGGWGAFCTTRWQCRSNSHRYGDSFTFSTP